MIYFKNIHPHARSFPLSQTQESCKMSHYVLAIERISTEITARLEHQMQIRPPKTRAKWSNKMFMPVFTMPRFSVLVLMVCSPMAENPTIHFWGASWLVTRRRNN